MNCYQTSFQVTNLGPFGSAAVDAGGLETGSSAIFLSHLLHLLCQLTSWRKHQTLTKIPEVSVQVHSDAKQASWAAEKILTMGPSPRSRNA